MNDYFSDPLAALVHWTGAIPEQPGNYYAGLPDPLWPVPSNILCFSRRAPFGERIGSLHHRFVLCICLQGAATVLIDEEAAHIEPATALLIFPHQFHLWADFTQKQANWLLVTFELGDYEVLEPLRGQRLALAAPALGVAALLAQHYAPLTHKRTASPVVTQACALLLALLMKEVDHPDRPLPPPSRSRQLIQKVVRHVHRHLASRLRLADIARAAGVSESHLRARFRHLTGMALGEYIRHIRIHRARILLRTTTGSIQEIADQCGYTSIYTFSRAFKNATGIAPTTLRTRAAP